MTQGLRLQRLQGCVGAAAVADLQLLDSACELCQCPLETPESDH